MVSPNRKISPPTSIVWWESMDGGQICIVGSEVRHMTTGHVIRGTSHDYWSCDQNSQTVCKVYQLQEITCFSQFATKCILKTWCILFDKSIISNTNRYSACLNLTLVFTLVIDWLTKFWPSFLLSIPLTAWWDNILWFIWWQRVWVLVHEGMCGSVTVS